MLLGNFFRAAFERGITLVATSNEAPENLYWNGLQRERFLPAIALIQAHTDVAHIGETWITACAAWSAPRSTICPSDPAAHSSLRSSFLRLTRGEGAINAVVEVEGRPILDHDWERMVAFYRYPKETLETFANHQSDRAPFAAVRLRTNAAKRFKKVENRT